MKKIFAWGVAALMIVSAVSCNSDSDADNTAYLSVYPGIVIYNAAATQQTVAMDPAAVAVKLAMLLDEAQVTEEEDLSQVKVTINGREYTLQALLFGSGVSISQEEESGNWLLNFMSTSGGSFENFLRRGTYRVITGGRGLTETTVDAPWRVVVDGEKLHIQGAESSTTQFYTIRGGETTLYCTKPGSYAIQLDQIKASVEGYDKFLSDWSGEMLFSTSTIEGDMSFSIHSQDTYTLSGEAGGVSFYSFNNSTTTQMRYSISALDPNRWMPSKSQPYSLIVSGEEKAYLTDESEYSTTSYPSPEVTVTRELENEKTIYTRITYNGTTLLW